MSDSSETHHSHVQLSGSLPPVNLVQSVNASSSSQNDDLDHRHRHKSDQSRNEYLDKMNVFWQDQLDEIDLIDFRTMKHALPLARIKKIMKSDEEVRMISAEAPVLFAKACEIFILDLTMRAWAYTDESKRRTLQRSDVCEAIAGSEIFDFLQDIVPKQDQPPAASANLIVNHQEQQLIQQGMPQHDARAHSMANMAHSHSTMLREREMTHTQIHQLHPEYSHSHPHPHPHMQQGMHPSMINQPPATNLAQGQNIPSQAQQTNEASFHSQQMYMQQQQHQQQQQHYPHQSGYYPDQQPQPHHLAQHQHIYPRGQYQQAPHPDEGMAASVLGHMHPHSYPNQDASHSNSHSDDQPQPHPHSHLTQSQGHFQESEHKDG